MAEKSTKKLIQNKEKKMYKLILFLVVSLISLGNIANASPYMMGKYLNGEISADDYMDSIGVPKTYTNDCED
jgi:hypothetical protein